METFHEMFLEILDSVAPVKSIRLKQRTEQLFAENMLRMIRVRVKPLKQYRKQNTSRMTAILGPLGPMVAAISNC